MNSIIPKRHSINRTKDKFSTFLQNLLGIIALILIWQLLAKVTHHAIMASPWRTLKALQGLITSGVLLKQLQITMGRLLYAMGLGAFIGIFLGCTAGFYQAIRNFIEPIRWVTMTIPPIIVAVLGMLWFGIGSQQVIFLVTFVITPSFISTP